MARAGFLAHLALAATDARFLRSALLSFLADALPPLLLNSVWFIQAEAFLMAAEIAAMALSYFVSTQFTCSWIMCCAMTRAESKSGAD
jgi:hypothetical protein